MPITSHDDIDWTLLARYIAGECSELDSARVAHWISANPERELIVDQLRTVWATAADSQRVQDVDKAIRQIHARIDTRSAFIPSSQAHSDDLPQRLSVARGVRRELMAGHQTIFNRRRAMAIAASLLVVVGGSTVAWEMTHGTPDKSSPVANPPMTEVATAVGQRAQVQLPDGSHVILAPKSLLRYSREYGARTRDLYLYGEAYFDVVHNERVPFRVYSSLGVTKDVGTKFAIRAYVADPVRHVVVAEGAVAVQPLRAPHNVTQAIDTQVTNPSEMSLLSAGDVMRMDSRGKSVIEHDIAVAPWLSWVDGHIEFENTPLTTAIQQLERWYDIDVRIGDSSLENRTITASFRDAPAEEVLDFVARAVNARIERLGKVAYLRSK